MTVAVAQRAIDLTCVDFDLFALFLEARAFIAGARFVGWRGKPVSRSIM